MQDIFEIKFPIEQHIKDDVILKFSNKQGGAYNIFSYYWQCFVWAATIGFIRDERKPLVSPIERIFTLNTMRGNGGEKDAQALICMCIARAGSLDIMKNPEEAVMMISEYANGGFYHIKTLMENGENSFNDFEKVKQEIFTRELDEANNIELKVKAYMEEPINGEVEYAEELPENTESTTPKEDTPKTPFRSHRWSVKEVGELQKYFKQGLTTEQLASFLERTENEVIEQLKKLGLM